MPDDVACVKNCFWPLNVSQFVINTKVEGRMLAVNYAILNINSLTRSHLPFSSTSRDAINRTTKSVAQTDQ